MNQKAGWPKKKVFEETNIPDRYFCRRSFATWDVLLPSEEAAKKLAGSNINTRFFRLQPEYQGWRKIKVTVSNVSMQLSGDVLAAYLSIYGDVEQVKQIKSPNGTAYGDYELIMNLDRVGFHAIPHSIKYIDQAMMVVVEGRRPLSWFCKQLGHFFRSYTQKATTIATTTTTTTTTTTKPTESITINETQTGDHPNKEGGWTRVTRGKNLPKIICSYNKNNYRKKSPKKKQQQLW